MLLLSCVLISATPVPSQPPSSEPASLPSKRGQEGETCLSRRDCSDGLECILEACVPPGAYVSCQRSADCAADLACRAHVCVGPNTPLPASKTRGSTTAGPAELPAALQGMEFPYLNGAPVPAGMRLERKSRIGLWATGLSFFATAWILAGSFGSAGLGSPLAFVPVFGGILGAAAVPSQAVGLTLATQIPLGIVQLLGTTLIFAGIFAKKKVLVVGSVTAELDVHVSTQGTSLSLFGRF